MNVKVPLACTQELRTVTRRCAESRVVVYYLRSCLQFSYETSGDSAICMLREAALIEPLISGTACSGKYLESAKIGRPVSPVAGLTLSAHG